MSISKTAVAQWHRWTGVALTAPVLLLFGLRDIKAILVVATLAGSPFATAAAQSLPIKAGDRVRVTAPGRGLHNLTGTFRTVRADTLVLDSLRVPRASVTRLEVSRGRKSNEGPGAVVGVVVGGLLGVVGGATGCAGDGFTMATGQCALSVLGGGVVVGLVGLVFGQEIGRSIKTDRWEQVPLDQLRVSFLPQVGGSFGVGLTVAF